MKHTWDNPLDPNNDDIWVELAKSPERVNNTYPNYLFNINNEIFLLATTISEKKAFLYLSNSNFRIISSFTG